MSDQCMAKIKLLAFSLNSMFGWLQDRFNTGKGPCPDPSYITRAFEFITRSGVQNDFISSGPGYGQCLQHLVYWMQTSPDPPKKLIAQCQITADILEHYTHRASQRPQVSDKYFLRNVPPRFPLSLISKWPKFSGLWCGCVST
ncbi:hypothetical protein BDZ97DRAFT_715552 [Flammula alnicola]|nr:hypothetical protein BDZ97DRAFT_715552 [Flammula alnicola]